jgi:hypothetical protein
VKLAEIFNAVPDRSALVEDHAINANATLPTFDPRYSKIVGTIDGRDVWGSRCFPQHHVFALRAGENVEAFIVLRDATVTEHNAHPLTRMFVSPDADKRGYVTALILFVTKKLQLRLILTHDEPLTSDGWSWVTSAIRHNRISAFNAQTGVALTADDIASDRTVGGKTDLAVLIEKCSSPDALFGSGEYRQLNEMIYVIEENSKFD